MSYSNQQIAKQVAELLRRNQQQYFQKGITTSTGVNREINVSLANGKVVRALGWNVSSPGQVNVFWDATNKRYVAWKEETSSLKRKTILVNRKTRPVDDKKYLWDYNFKVLQPSSIEGFDADVALDLTGYQPVGITNTGSGYNVILKNETEIDSFVLVGDSESVVIEVPYSEFYRYNANNPNFDINAFWSYKGEILYGYDLGHVPFVKGWNYSYNTVIPSGADLNLTVYCDKTIYPNSKNAFLASNTINTYPNYPSATWNTYRGSSIVGTGTSSYNTLSNGTFLGAWVVYPGQFILNHSGEYLNKLYTFSLGGNTTLKTPVSFEGRINTYNEALYASDTEEDRYTFYNYERFTENFDETGLPFSGYAASAYDYHIVLRKITNWMSIHSPYPTRVREEVSEYKYHRSYLPKLLTASSSCVITTVEVVDILEEYSLDNTVTFSSRGTNAPLTLVGNVFLSRIDGTDDYGTRTTTVYAPYHTKMVIDVGGVNHTISDFLSGEINFDNRFFCVSTTGIGGYVALSPTGSNPILNYLYVGVDNNYKNYYQQSPSISVIDYTVAGDGSQPSLAFNSTQRPYTGVVVEGVKVFVCDMTNNDKRFYSATIASLDYTDENEQYNTYVRNGISIGSEMNTKRTYTGLSLANVVDITDEVVADSAFFAWENIVESKMIIVPEDDYTTALVQYLKITNGVNANAYVVELGDGTLTAEIAISQPPTDTAEKDEWRADIYRFNTATLKWERRPNAVSPLTQLTAASDFISYHPTPSNSVKKKRRPPR